MKLLCQNFGVFDLRFASPVHCLMALLAGPSRSQSESVHLTLHRALFLRVALGATSPPFESS